MRRLATAAALLLVLAGCGGSSPTEPGGRPARGNWIGTISGTHADLGVRGTCDFEMNLDTTFTGQWWIDCPGGASSQGQVIGIAFLNSVIFTFISLNPLSDCPWDGTSNSVTATAIAGDFEVTDCSTNTVRSTGTFTLRKR
jgi:hypothetical protein